METTNNMAASSVESPSRAERVRMGPVAFSGFPVRSLTRQLDGTNGEWITAYQADQKTRLRVVLSTSMRGGIESGRTIRPPTNTREVSGAPRKMLDRMFLLKHCYVEEPNDLCVCNISGEGLKVYKPEDFTLFDNVVYINAADNQLPLEAFATFPLLQDLELTLNSIVNVSFMQGEFTKLQTLDLSYNSLSGMALLALGTLPLLKELHLTGNNIVALPAEMSRPFPAPKLKPDSDDGTLFQIRFPALERLWLDDNKLMDQSTFSTLAGLRRLRYLNLDNNEIYTIPQLRLIGTSPLKVTTDKHTSTQYTTLTHAASKENDEESAISTDARTPPSSVKSQASKHITTLDTAKVSPVPGAIRTDLSPSIQAPPNTAQKPAKPLSKHLESTLQKPHHVKTCGESTPTLLTVDPPDGLPGPPGRLSPSHSVAPFPQLETLSLANNLILMAEGLLACGSWSSLTELIVHGNPLTRTARGMPPLLQTHLVERSGISVVRHKPSPRKRHTIGKAAKEFKKVSSAPPPPIPKHPLPALEAPPDVPMLVYPSPLSSAPFPSSPSSLSQSSATESPQVEEEEEGRGKEQEGNGKVLDGQPGVFMTQGAGEEQEGSYPQERRGQAPLPVNVEEKCWSARQSFRDKRKELKQKYRDVHDRYKGYEALLDTYEDPSMPIPADPNGCTRALQYALRHPLVVPDTGVPSPRPVNTGDYLKRKPSATTSLHKLYTSSKVRDLQCVLDDIRTRCIALETNLGTLLQPQTPPEKKSIGKLQKESQQLLAEMQARYNKVRSSSLGILKSASEFSNSPTTTPSTSRRHSSHLLPEDTRNSSPKLS